MKKLFVTVFCLFLILSFAKSQEVNSININSTIKKVPGFLTGGEENRAASVSLKKGRNKLIFTNISTVADHKSVQFNADKEFNLVSVSAEIDYLSFIENNPRIKLIQDSLNVLRNKVVDLQNEKDAYEAEKGLLQKNNSIKGDNQNLSVDELRNMATYYRTRIMELNKIITEYNNNIAAQNSLFWR